MYGLTKANKSYTFYHDETNNIRKLHVGARGLNVAELKVFVLGGVVHDGPGAREAGRSHPNRGRGSREEIAIRKSPLG